MDTDVPSSTCPCGKRFDVDHAMLCMKGRFVHRRHDDVRDQFASLLEDVYHDVEIDPHLGFRYIFARESPVHPICILIYKSPTRFTFCTSSCLDTFNFLSNFQKLRNATWRDMTNFLNCQGPLFVKDNPLVAYNTIPTFVPFSQCQ